MTQGRGAGSTTRVEPGPHARPTLAAVAARVGVSRTTASNAYNRPDQLSPAMRARILAAAAELGYAGPDPVARSLRTQRAGAVGMVLADRLSRAFADPAAVEFLQGVGRACEEHASALMLVPAGQDDVATHTDTVARAAVDGFVVFSMPAGDPHVLAVLGRPQPAVIVDSPRGVAGVDFVGVDDRRGFRLVTEHVLALGHRRITVLTAPCGVGDPARLVDAESALASTSSVVVERVGGLVEAVRDAGLDASAIPLWMATTHSPDEGREGVRRLLRCEPRPTAIVCGSDGLALGALAELAELGVDVPREISVTGFDDVPAAAGAGLTTVGQPTRDKGYRAAELLLDPVPRPGPRRVILPVDLVVRATTAEVITEGL